MVSLGGGVSLMLPHSLVFIIHKLLNRLTKISTEQASANSVRSTPTAIVAVLPI